MWCRLLERSHNGLVVSKLNCAVSLYGDQRQENTKEIGCLQAETRQQKTSIHQWYLQPFRCTGTQFKESRWELDSLQRHGSLFINGFPRTSISHKHQEWFDEDDEGIQGLLEEKHQKHKAYLSDTSSVSTKTAYSNICKTVQTRHRDMQDSWLSKKAEEIQSFADRKDMKSSLMHLRQYMVPRAQEPPHSLVQMELVFWLIKKLSWKDGLNALIVSSSINDEAINRLPQVDCNPLLDEFPNVSETVKAIKRPSSGKTPGSDEIYLQNPTKQEVIQLQRNWQSCFTLCGIKKPSLKNSKMQQSSIYSNGKGSSSLWQSSGHLFIVSCLKDRCNGPTKPIEWIPWTVRASTRKPMWIQEGQSNNWHFHSKAASREMSGTKCELLRNLCRLYQSIWHSQSWETLENYGKLWLSCQIHSSGATVPWWYACKGPQWW